MAPHIGRRLVTPTLLHEVFGVEGVPLCIAYGLAPAQQHEAPPALALPQLAADTLHRR
jgi:hypothetical protein